ncbi:hypothetical protein V8E55_011867 [Tylopilus felleus]
MQNNEKKSCRMVIPPLSQPTPPLRTIEEVCSGHDRRSFATSSRRGDGDSPAARFLDRRGASSSEPSSSSTNSPPPIFDKSPIPGSGVISDDSAPPEDVWSELKPYLEAQTESIVYAIQSVLSGIITIVSSIVAVCSGNVPPASAQQGAEILEQLSEHAKKLQEVQVLPEVMKESQQIMAKSSFAIANAMKGLMKLGER